MTVVAQTSYELELEVEATIIRGVRGITHLAPEKCRPTESPVVEIQDVWILTEEGGQSQKLIEIPPALMEILSEAVLDRADDNEKWER